MSGYHPIQIKRIYEDPDINDGYRVLVDRLWPRGVSKEDAQLDDWMKGITPSTELRKWFDHDTNKFKEFKTRYRKELDDEEDYLNQLIDKSSKKKVTLLYAAKNKEINHAVVLKDTLNEIREMNHQQYINQAVKLATENIKNGGKPFGTVIVKDDTVITTGINKAIQTGDLTSHAEIEAIREAGREGKNDQLNGATLYASGHPCPMCLSAIYLVGIKEVYYASTLEKAEEAGLGVSHIYKELKKGLYRQKIPLHQYPTTLSVNPMKIWKEN